MYVCVVHRMSHVQYVIVAVLCNHIYKHNILTPMHHSLVRHSDHHPPGCDPLQRSPPQGKHTFDVQILYLHLNNILTTHLNINIYCRCTGWRARCVRPISQSRPCTGTFRRRSGKRHGGRHTYIPIL